MTKKKIKILSLSLLGATALVVPTAITAVSCAGININNDNTKQNIAPLNNVTAQSLGFDSNMIAYNATKSISKIWIINHLSKLVSGNISLIRTESDIVSFDAKQTSNNKIVLDFVIAKNKTYENSVLNPLERPVSVEISNFKEAKPLSIKSSYTASDLGLNGANSGVVESAKITKTWIFNQIKSGKLLDGELNLINSEQDIEMIGDVVGTANTIEFSFYIAANKSYNSDGKPNPNKAGPFNINVTNFTAPSSLESKPINITNVSVLNASQFAYKQLNAITPEFVKNNIDTFISGDTTLIKQASNASDAIVVKSTVSGDNGMTTSIIIKGGYWYDTETGLPSLSNQNLTFTYNFIGFTAPTPISQKPNFNIENSGLTEFAKNTPIETTIENISNKKQWIVDNKNILFTGTLDELNSPNAIKTVTLSSEGDNGNKYYVNKLKIDVTLNQKVSIINGEPTNTEPSFTIYVNNFDTSISKSVIDFTSASGMNKISNFYTDYYHASTYSAWTIPNEQYLYGGGTNFQVYGHGLQKIDWYKKAILRMMFAQTGVHGNFDSIVKYVNGNNFILKIDRNNSQLLKTVIGYNLNQNNPDQGPDLNELLNNYQMTDVSYFEMNVEIIKTNADYTTEDNSAIKNGYNYFKLKFNNSFTAYNNQGQKLFTTLPAKYEHNFGSNDLTDTPFYFNFSLFANNI